MRLVPLWLLGTGLLVLAGLLGFVARGWLPSSRLAPARYQVPSMVELRDEPSFSEVETARAVIGDAAVCYVGDVLARHQLGPFKPVEDVAPGRPGDSDWEGALLELGRGMAEFKGTGQELFLIERTLGLLRTAGRQNEWLTLYLETLYRHPTDPLNGRQAACARTMAAAVGRQAELQRAWDWLLRIPRDFQAQSEVRTLVRVEPSGDGLVDMREEINAEAAP